MDDDMETEIVREVFFAHFHLIWKYLSVTSSGIAEMILPGPGETFKSKMLQPGPFMLLTLIIIISSIILQTKHNWLQKVLLTCHRTISLNVVADHSLKSFVSASIGNENVVQDLTEGIAGVYALQGRRGAMEDRFSVMQDVDVGGSNKPSFYGVYDGHGGQFVVEYVKQNLFMDTVQKIRQARSSKDKNGSEKSKEEAAVNGKRRKSSSCLLSSIPLFSPGTSILTVDPPQMKERRPSSSPAPPPTKERRPSSSPAPPLTKEKRPSSSPAPPLTKERRLSSSPNDLPQTKERQASSPTIPLQNANSNAIENYLETMDSSLSNHDEKSGKEDILKLEKEVAKKDEGGTKVEEVNAGVEEQECVSLKDYTCQYTRKRSSGVNAFDLTGGKEAEARESRHSNPYIDVNSNINYTKLLNDQIMDIDEKVVNFCKSKTDFSGTTAVIAVLDGELLIIGNVGDSRAVMGDLKGSTIPLSFDHKPNQLKERRRIKEAGGFITFTGVWRVAGVLATSRALGDFPLKDPRKFITAEPDVLTFSLKDHKAHFVILATDGLWDVLSNEEAVAFVKDHIHERDYGARSLVLHAYNKGSQDNITAMILNLSKLSF